MNEFFWGFGDTINDYKDLFAFFVIKLDKFVIKVFNNVKENGRIVRV